MFKSALSSFLNPNETTLKPLDEFQSTIKRNPHPLFIPVTSKTVNSNEQTALQPSSVSTPADKPYAFPLLTPQSTSKGWRLVLEEQPNKAYIPVLKYVSMLSRASSMIEDTPMKDANKNMSNVGSFMDIIPSVLRPKTNPTHTDNSNNTVPTSSQGESSTNKPLWNSVSTPNDRTNIPYGTQHTQNNTSVMNMSIDNLNEIIPLTKQRSSLERSYSSAHLKLPPFFTRQSKPKDTRRPFTNLVPVPRRTNSMPLEYVERLDPESSYDAWSQLGEKRKIERTDSIDRRVLPKTALSESTDMFTSTSNAVSSGSDLNAQSRFSTYVRMT